MEEKTQEQIWKELAEPMEYKTYDKPLKKTGGKVTLAYIDARQVMDRLDAVVEPENWQCDYKVLDGKMYCGIAIRNSKNLSTALDGNLMIGDWVWKWDMGTESEGFEEEKGEASDAFKRAAVKWGIGRFLYDIKPEQSKLSIAPIRHAPIKKEEDITPEMKVAQEAFNKAREGMFEEARTCPECGGEMNFNPEGKFGPYYNCPNCKKNFSKAKLEGA